MLRKKERATDMKKLIFATGNENKMKEIRMILGDLDYEILSMKEAGIDADIVEDGKTFEENAIIKATAISKLPLAIKRRGSRPRRPQISSVRANRGIRSG